MTSIETVRKSNRRILAFVMVLLLCLTLLPSAALAANTSATTMSLMDWEGEKNVTVKTSSGTAKTVRKGMSLYNGYTVTTGAGGRAWIALDGSKTITLNASSSVEVRSSGGKIDVLLNAGELNFSSDGPVGAGKNYNVITQNAVCGIIGSFGWADSDAIGLVHGKTKVTCVDPVTGKVVVKFIDTGTLLSYVGDEAHTNGMDAALNQIGFETRRMRNEDVPGSMVRELIDDLEKQKQASEVDTLNVPALIDSLPEKLAAEAAAAAAAQAAADAAAAAQELRVRAEAGAAITVPEDSGTSEGGSVTVGGGAVVGGAVGTEDGGKILDLWDADGKDIAGTGETDDNAGATTTDDSGATTGGSGGDSGSGGSSGGDSGSGGGTTPDGEKHGYLSVNFPGGTPSGFTAVPATLAVNGSARAIYTFDNGVVGDPASALATSTSYNFDAHAGETLTFTVGDGYTLDGAQTHAKLYDNDSNLTELTPSVSENTCAVTIPSGAQVASFIVDLALVGTATVEEHGYLSVIIPTGVGQPVDVALKRGATVISQYVEGSESATYTVLSGETLTLALGTLPDGWQWTVSAAMWITGGPEEGITAAVEGTGNTRTITVPTIGDSDVLESFIVSVVAEQSTQTQIYDITIDSSVAHGTVTATMDGVNPVTGAEAGKSVILGFTPDDGYEINAVSVVPDGGGTVETSAISDNGCTFTMPAKPVTVSASFTPRTYAVTLHTNGGTINAGDVTSYTYNTDTLLPTDVTRDGYRFDGWFAEESGGTNSVGVIAAGASGAQEYWAYWTQLYGVTVTSPQNGTVTVDKQTAAAGETVTLTATPATGYALDALTVTYGNNLTVELTQDTTNTTKWSFAMPAGNAAAAATFTAADYAVTLHTNGGTINAGNVTSYTYNTDTLLPTDVTRDGYRFDGWFAEESGGTNSVGVIAAGASGPQEYWAYWTQLYTVTVTQPTNGMLSADKSSAAADETVTLTMTPATGYVLDQLAVKDADNGTVAVDNNAFAMPAKNVTVTATFKVATYTVTLNPNEGTINAGNVTGYTYGTGATLPTDVTREGFRFDGWYDAASGGSRVTAIGTAETGAKEYWAHWTQLYTVTVTQPTNGMLSADKATAAAGETVTLTVTPETGYELETLTVKDADNGAVTVNDDTFEMPAKAVTVTATFTPATYAVKLNENGGTFGDSHVQNYTYGVGATLPDDLTRSGFRFDGWYDAASDGSRVTAIGTTETGDKEYWAYWTQLYGVTVADGYANGTVKINGTQTDSADFAAGETVTLTFIGDKPADPEDTGIPYLAGYDGGEVDIRTGGQKVDGVSHVSDVRDLDENTWTSTYSFEMPAGDVDVNAEFRRGFFAVYRSGDSADAQKYYDLVETNMDYSEGYTTLSASDCGFTPPQSGQAAAWSQSGVAVQPGTEDWFISAEDPTFTAIWGYTATFNLTGGVPTDDYLGVALFSGEETEEDLFGSDGQPLAEDGETFVIPAGTLVKVRAYDEAVASVSCDDPNVNVSYDESSETYSFTMPAKNAAVTVAYRLRYTLTLAQSKWTGTYLNGGTEYQADYATAALTADDGSELPAQILPGTKIKLTVTALAEDPQSTPKPVIETNVRVTKDGGSETVDLVMESRSGTDGQHDQRVTVYTFEMPEFNATVSMDFTQEVEGVGVLVYDMETGVTVNFATAADAQSVVASPDGTVSDGNITFRTARGPDEPMYFRLNFTEQPDVFRVESDGEELTAADGWYTVPEGGSIRVYTVRRTLTLTQTNGTGTVAATAASGAAVTFTSGTATVFAHDTITLTITPPTGMTVSQVWFKPTDGSASGYEISSNYGADNEYSIWPTSYDATVEVTYA